MAVSDSLSVLRRDGYEVHRRRRTDRLSVVGAGQPARPTTRRIRAYRLERRTDCPSYDDGYELIGWKTDRLSVLRGDGYEVHRRGRTDRLSGSAVSGGCGLRRAGRPSVVQQLKTGGDAHPT